MIIWVIAFVLVGLCMLAGYMQGAIRASSSIVGLLVASLLAIPLSGLFRPILHLTGVQSSLLLDALSPVAGFLVVLILVKVAGQTIHQKTEYYFKYKQENRYPHWERLNKRLGFCVGVLGGAIYFFLVSLVVYVGGYLTYQLSSGEKDTAGLRALNSARQEITDTHFDRVLAAHDPAPEQYYNAADIAGLVYHNVLLESRIRRYPAFLSLAERPDFQELGNDVQFQNLWQSGACLNEILKYPKVHAMVDDPALTAELKRTVGDNLKDLREFLETGKSSKFSNQKLLGRWLVNTDASLAAYRRAQKALTPAQISRTRIRLLKEFGDNVFIAGPENNMAVLKTEVETPTAAAATPGTKATGTWSEDNGTYSASLTADGKTENSTIKFDNDNRITLTRSGLPVVFDREL